MPLAICHLFYATIQDFVRPNNYCHGHLLLPRSLSSHRTLFHPSSLHPCASPSLVQPLNTIHCLSKLQITQSQYTLICATSTAIANPMLIQNEVCLPHWQMTIRLALYPPQTEVRYEILIEFWSTTL